MIVCCQYISCHFFSRGVIFKGNESYVLEPVLNTSGSEHILYPLESGQSEPFVCGVDNDHGHDTFFDHTLSMGAFLRVRNVCLFLSRYSAVHRIALDPAQTLILPFFTRADITKGTPG